MKVIFELEVGMETSMIIVALEQEIKLFEGAAGINCIQLPLAVARRLRDDLVAKVEASYKKDLVKKHPIIPTPCCELTETRTPECFIPLVEVGQ
jgi:hypothetical protein